MSQQQEASGVPTEVDGRGLPMVDPLVWRVADLMISGQQGTPNT
jgi:hypothetical protein